MILIITRLFPFLLLAVCARVVADDVVITVTGRVVPLPCTVDTTQLNMDLGKIYASELSKAGSSGQWVNGTIRLSNCPALTSGITASFSGRQGAKFYRNSGTAGNVEIELQSDAGNDLSDGKSIKLGITPQRTAELPVKVRAYTGTGKASDGTIQGTINVTYTYQ